MQTNLEAEILDTIACPQTLNENSYFHFAVCCFSMDLHCREHDGGVNAIRSCKGCVNQRLQLQIKLSTKVVNVDGV